MAKNYLVKVALLSYSLQCDKVKEQDLRKSVRCNRALWSQPRLVVANGDGTIQWREGEAKWQLQG